MGIFDKIKDVFGINKNTGLNSALLNSFGNLGSTPMSPEKYAQYRDRISKYFECKYDYATLEGIEAIPDKEDFYGNTRADDTSVERIESFLRQKAWEHEKAGNVEMCIACLRKANRIMENSETKYSDMMMTLVDRLRKYRRFDDANKEKERLGKIFTFKYLEEKDKIIYYLLYEHLPDICPKSFSGFMRMKNMKSKNYLKIIEVAKAKCVIPNSYT